MKKFIKCPRCKIVQFADDNSNNHKCITCELLITKYDLQPLKALSIKQPWAWLIVNGFKDIENRNHLKNFRGDFLIHAGKKFDVEWAWKLNHNFFEKLYPKIKNVDLEEIKKGGGIIGSATIVDCVEVSNSPWFNGKYGFVIKNPKPLPFTPCKGQLSFFKPEIF